MEEQETAAVQQALEDTRTALKACETRFRNIINRGADGVLIVTEDGIVRFANPAAEQLLASSSESLIGANFGFPVVAGETTEIDLVCGNHQRQTCVAEMRVVETEWDGERVYLAMLRDITDRKLAAERLRRNKERYRLLAENTVDAIWRMDPDTTFTYINPAIETMTGFTPEEWIGSTLREHCDAENFAEMQAVIQEALSRLPATEGIVFETTILKKNGEPLPVEITGRVLADEQGQPVALQGITRDITERKQAAQKIEDLARFPEENPNPVLRASPEGEILYANSAAKRILKECNRQKDGVLPENWQQLAHDIFLSGAPQDVEKTCAGRTFSLTFAPVVDKDYINVYGLDITERKKTEAALWESRHKLRLIMDHIPQAIFWKDKDSVYLGCNRAFAEDAGADNPKEVIGKDDFAMPWSQEADLYRTDDQHVIETGTPRLRYEEPQTTPEGDKIWLETSKVPLRDASGEVIGVLGLYDDITARREAETREQQYTHRLETLHQIDQAILEARSTQAIVRAAFQGLRDLTACQDFSVMLFDRKREQARVLMGLLEKGQKIDMTETPLAWFRPLETLERGEAHVVDDLETHQQSNRVEQRLLARGMRSHLSVPLATDKGLIGALNLAAKQPGAFTKTEVGIAREVADQLAIALRQTQLREQVEQHTQELEQRIRERTAELQRMVDLMTGREIRMAELKDVIKQLHRQLRDANITPAADDPLLSDND